MNKWVLLQSGERPPVLAQDEFILLAMAQGGILRVMYRFVKNIRGNIAGYLVHDTATPVAIPYWLKLKWTVLTPLHKTGHIQATQVA